MICHQQHYCPLFFQIKHVDSFLQLKFPIYNRSMVHFITFMSLTSICTFVSFIFSNNHDYNHHNQR